MATQKEVVYAKRLLENPRDRHSFEELLFFARDHADGRTAIKELGHFAAHRGKRNEGLTTIAVQNWILSAEFIISTFRAKAPRELTLDRLPACTKEYLHRCAFILGPQTIRRATKRKYRTAKKQLQKLSARLVQSEDGYWTFPKDGTSEEVELIRAVTSVLKTSTAFSANDATTEFFDVLRSGGLLCKRDIEKLFEPINQLVTAYAVASMHRCKVKSYNGEDIELLARLEMENKKISVSASTGKFHPTIPNLRLSSSIFETEVDLDQIVENSLMTTSDWAFYLEINKSGRLEMLQ